MSKISVDINALLQVNKLISPGSGELKSSLNKHIEVDDNGTDFYLDGRSYDVTETTSFNITTLTGYRDESIDLANLRLAVIHVIKTAEEVSGTFEIVSTTLGISTGTITLTSNERVAAAEVGAVIETLVKFSLIGWPAADDDDLVITLGTPVGFKLQVLLSGDLS